MEECKSGLFLILPLEMMYILLKKLCYAYLKFFVRIAQFVYFRRVEINGDRKTAAGQAAIYGVRHPNALMDPLMVSAPVTRNLYFLARGDLFANKVVARIMDMVNMIPIFRMRDGGNSVNRNAATFERCRTLLLNGAGIQIFPEGEHSSMHKLLPLKKGAARIAMPALDADPNVQVALVPVGLNYSNERKFRACVSVNFGAALQARDHFDPENQEAGITALTLELEASLRTLVLDLRDPAPYEAANELRETLEIAQYGLCPPKFAESKALCEQLVSAWSTPAKQDRLAQLAAEHAQLRQEMNLPEAGIPLETKNAQPSLLQKAMAILFAPLFFLGALFHAPMLWLAHRTPRLIEDDIFFSAVRMVTGIFLGQALYLIYFFLSWFLLGSALWALGVLLGIAICGIVALPCYDVLGEWRRSLRLKKFAQRAPEATNKLLALQEEILALFLHP